MKGRRAVYLLGGKHSSFPQTVSQLFVSTVEVTGHFQVKSR